VRPGRGRENKITLIKRLREKEIPSPLLVEELRCSAGKSGKRNYVPEG
jgi:hypothetical protein